MNSVDQRNAFIKHVKILSKKFTESRSSLRKLLIFLKVPANKNKKFLSVQDVKNQCANPHDPRLIKYGPALKELQRVWGTSQDYGNVASVIPAPSSTDNKARILVEEVRAELEKCRLYACNDAATFPQCISPYVSQEERARIRNPDAIAVGIPIFSPDNSWKTSKLKAAYEAVNDKKAGECTNYAYYAAHILANGKTTPKPRIEIVSWEGEGTTDKHVFVLVGRKGKTFSDKSLPHPCEWNNDIRIVDCWALTLGWECIYTKEDYCFKDTMMYPVKIHMDSTIKDLGIPMDLQAGLKKTGIDVTK